MPLLTRMVATPLAVEVRPGAIDALGPLLADRRISSGGQVAVVVGTGLGEEIAARLGGSLPEADVKHVDGGSVETAMALAKELRAGFYDAIVGIGGGRTLDTAKYAASLSGQPLVAVATSLAHDGIASPVSSLYEESGRKTSIGVQMPVAVVVDLDYVRRSAPEMRRSGVGDTLSNLSAIADWRLAAAERGEEVDGIAVTFAQTAALAVLHRQDGIEDEEFLMALADGLILSGLAMSTAGSSRPCSGADHEIVHAIDHLYPQLGPNHGELAGAAALFCTWLRGDEPMAAAIDACLVRHGLPRTPGDLGLTEEQFVAAVVEAPNTRPDRYTILEHLDLDEEGVRGRVGAFLAAFDR
jgi:glycerol-1-phosphate dehydrogenase [NAD(P)+]